MSATIHAARICGSYTLAALAQAPGVANLDALIERGQLKKRMERKQSA